MTTVVACIDGSIHAPAVCDCAAWASLRIEAPLMLLHVLDHQRYPVPGDYSGNIGLGSREHLLEELTALDVRRGRLALEQGRHMLQAATARVVARGQEDVELKQRHGDLAQALRELEERTRLLVMGKRGEERHDSDRSLGHQLERVIRHIHRPILITPQVFLPPRSLMFAFDGRPTANKGIEMIANSPLLKGMSVHLVMVGAETSDAWARLRQARQTLVEAGFDVLTAICEGEVERTLHNYQCEKQIDLLVMGAYGHSRLRELLLGSTTNKMLAVTDTPVLLIH
ncbi:universal stress protein [Stutzerimonas urumqiensis]|uniref:universal stress protein n=1 Tax=Stutzerimonas urumqiensis TaxID=638269 RepID=UPI003BA85569